jgi:fructose-1,6-bisphosphatase/inositol monophosphatase family enzyme
MAFRSSALPERRGRLELAVVSDALKRERFVAARGRGAWLSGRPIHVSATPSLDRALLTTPFRASGGIGGISI